MLESNLKTKMRNLIIELLIERRQIYNDFCNFDDEQAGNTHLYQFHLNTCVFLPIIHFF
jgi:hypothetical protein